MNGVVVINKPSEYTSFDVVAVVRKYTGIKKCGHCGTLDPNATGVLPVLVGNATKAQDIIPNHDKAYTARFRLGAASDTLDVWGTVTLEQKSNITTDQLLSAVSHFVGDIMQTPPMYSAVSKDGVRLYELARKGIEIERQARPVTIYELSVTEFDETTQTGELRVSCSKGTYIRQLISDIAKELGTVGIMTSLVRTFACGFDISDAMDLDEFKAMCIDKRASECLHSVDSLFADYVAVCVSDAQATRFSNGNMLDISRTELKNSTIADKTIVRVKDKNDVFLGLGIVDEDSNSIKIYKNFSTKN